MIRSAITLLLIALSVLAPLSVRAATPVEDPRKCLFDEAPASETDKEAAAVRCIAVKGWHPLTKSALEEIYYREKWSRPDKKALESQGFDVSWIDGFLATLDAPARTRILYPKGSQFRDEIWPLFAGRFGRSVAPGDAQFGPLWNYVRARVFQANALKAFERVAGGMPSGTFVVEAWQVLPAVEAARPVFTPRELTKEERAELREISGTYNADTKDGTGEAAQLDRLRQLGETGDKMAMIAVRDALAGGFPRELHEQYDAYLIDKKYLRETREVLVALWTAHIWQLHGYDDASRKYMGPCIRGFGSEYDYKGKRVSATLSVQGTVWSSDMNGNYVEDSTDACGFTLLGQSVKDGRAKGATVLQFHDHMGQHIFEKDYFITGARFYPLTGDALFNEAKYLANLKRHQEGAFIGRQGNEIFSPALGISGPWFSHYASETRRGAQLQEADARSSAQVRARLNEERRQAAEKWNQAVAAYNANPAAPDRAEKLRAVASELGLEYVGKFMALVPDWNRTAAHASGVFPGGGSGFGSQQVEVRSYDSNGNYTGSTRTSAVWADIMRSTSAAPR